MPDAVTRRRFLTLSGAVGAGAVLAACGKSTDKNSGATSDTLAEARKRGSIRIAFINNKPLSYTDDKTGKLTGSGPAVLSAILAKLGVSNVDPVLVDFDAMIPGLIANRWDMSAFPFYVTPKRCEQVAFTNPMAQYLEGALVHTGNPKGIHSFTDLAKPDVKVAIQTGNAEIDWAKAAGVKESQIQLFQEEALAVEAVRQGRADAYLNGTFALVQDLKNYGASGLEIAKPFKGPIVDGKEVIAYGGWALRSQDTTLRDGFNAELAKMLDSGELLKLQSPYGYDQDSLPPKDVTAKTLCPNASWK
ncbi:ectoine/hydroxyectoine ABC transporter substrate-binding protein EhuB [Dactylosporangium sp. AC04546]|uniref:ectoine/hydroxyectoine ABC transporter substrate-binding protein EhuB n=1 Tax=Dactylosporangium sp. AC04546 TaxID=2862460 RepID=UPI001EDD67C2|nr:ectoine/hydroxyectoine ABC transporter substrate-binding protein EhuB [Dactylosporangium sp. AC04546]WVK86593.1 ectoine/hydroxyectoine ABC transporter substrate-binding protein EhuB [Dactylosporangium sp. AC04546]